MINKSQHRNLNRHDLSRSFSKLSITLAMCIALQNIAIPIIDIICVSINPLFLYNPWYRWMSIYGSLILVSFPIVWFFLRTIPKYCITEKHNLSCHEFIVITLICFGLIYTLSYVMQLVISLLYALTNTNSHYIIPTSFPIMSFASNFLFGVILVPIFEGLFFRKMIISRLIILGERFSILISAMLFSLFHTNIFQFVSSYIIGLILSYVYLKTGQLKQSIFMHSILNLFGFIIAPFLLTLQNIGTVILLVWIVFCMIAGIALLVMNRKKIKVDYGIGIIREAQKISMFLRTPGFICYLILCLSISLAYVFEFI